MLAPDAAAQLATEPTASPTTRTVHVDGIPIRVRTAGFDNRKPDEPVVVSKVARRHRLRRGTLYCLPWHSLRRWSATIARAPDNPRGMRFHRPRTAWLRD
jgi:hypothetical protein